MRRYFTPGASGRRAVASPSASSPPLLASGRRPAPLVNPGASITFSALSALSPPAFSDAFVALAPLVRLPLLIVVASRFALVASRFALVASRFALVASRFALAGCALGLPRLLLDLGHEVVG